MAIVSLSHKLDVTLLCERFFHSCAKDRMIIGDENSHDNSRSRRPLNPESTWLRANIFPQSTFKDAKAKIQNQRGVETSRRDRVPSGIFSFVVVVVFQVCIHGANAYSSL